MMATRKRSRPKAKRRTPWQALNEAVLGPSVWCDCGGGAGHNFDIRDGKLHSVFIANTKPTTVMHRIYVNGSHLLSIGTAALSGLGAWYGTEPIVIL